MKCPSCPHGELERVHAPWLLRLLRHVPGLNPLLYRCDVCGRTITRWRGEN